MTRELTLPSGAILSIREAPFTDANALHQAVLMELRGVPFSAAEKEEVLKQIACVGFSSKTIERCIWKCLEKCLYTPADGPGAGSPERVTTATFEAANRRQDWVAVCAEVTQENVGPFLKGLFALYSTAVEAPKNSPASESPTTTS